MMGRDCPLIEEPGILSETSALRLAIRSSCLCAGERFGHPGGAALVSARCFQPADHRSAPLHPLVAVRARPLRAGTTCSGDALHSPRVRIAARCLLAGPRCVGRWHRGGIGGQGIRQGKPATCDQAEERLLWRLLELPPSGRRPRGLRLLKSSFASSRLSVTDKPV
jgi:hypothetical protein